MEVTINRDPIRLPRLADTCRRREERSHAKRKSFTRSLYLIPAALPAGAGSGAQARRKVSPCAQWKRQSKILACPPLETGIRTLNVLLTFDISQLRARA
jgi:hypothetical protein